MRLYNLRGKLMFKNVSRYIIKWDGKSRSKLQFKVKQFLKPYWRGHIVYEEFPVYGSRLSVDILNASFKLAIEVQGEQHTQFHYFHAGKPVNYLDGIKRDVKKQEWLEKNDFKLIEINYDEIEKLSSEFFKSQYGVDLII